MSQARKTFPDGTELMISRVTHGLHIDLFVPESRRERQVFDGAFVSDTDLPALLLALIAATRALVTADNCGYLRNTMRYEGYFDAARAALLAVTGEDLTPGERLHDARSVYDELLEACEALLPYAQRFSLGDWLPSQERAINEARAVIERAQAAREQEI